MGRVIVVLIAVVLLLHGALCAHLPAPKAAPTLRATPGFLSTPATISVYWANVQGYDGDLDAITVTLLTNSTGVQVTQAWCG